MVCGEHGGGKPGYFPTFDWLRGKPGLFPTYNYARRQAWKLPNSPFAQLITCTAASLASAQREIREVRVDMSGFVGWIRLITKLKIKMAGQGSSLTQAFWS